MKTSKFDLSCCISFAVWGHAAGGQTFPMTHVKDIGSAADVENVHICHPPINVDGCVTALKVPFFPRIKPGNGNFHNRWYSRRQDIIPHWEGGRWRLKGCRERKLPNANSDPKSHVVGWRLAAVPLANLRGAHIGLAYIEDFSAAHMNVSPQLPFCGALHRFYGSASGFRSISRRVSGDPRGFVGAVQKIDLQSGDNSQDTNEPCEYRRVVGDTFIRRYLLAFALEALIGALYCFGLQWWMR